MPRRQRIGVALAAVVLLANAGVWFALRQPDQAPPDTRGILRGQLLSEWEGLPSAPLDGAEATLAQALRSESDAADLRDVEGPRTRVSFATLAGPERKDLLEAIGEAVTAIGKGDADALLAYMASRGMKPDPRSLTRVLARSGRSVSSNLDGDAEQFFKDVWSNLQVDPQWDSWVPDATVINVWQPPTPRHVSPIQLGRTASWVWGNETLLPTTFASVPGLQLSHNQKPPPLADVRVVIEHDGESGHGRSPYFFRFWRCEQGPATWRPMVMKLVKTTPGEAPSLLF